MYQHTRGGARLRAWLKEQGRTQEWLASKIGTHQTNVSSWMLGRVIPLEMAIAIRKITKIQVEDWVIPATTKRSRAVAAAASAAASSVDVSGEQAEAS